MFKNMSKLNTCLETPQILHFRISSNASCSTLNIDEPWSWNIETYMTPPPSHRKPHPFFFGQGTLVVATLVGSARSAKHVPWRPARSPGCHVLFMGWTLTEFRHQKWWNTSWESSEGAIRFSKRQHFWRTRKGHNLKIQKSCEGL